MDSALILIKPYKGYQTGRLKRCMLALATLMALGLVGNVYSITDSIETSDGENISVSKIYFLAEKGNAEAMAYLGYMHHMGEGVPQSYELAIEWFKKAAIWDNRDAQYNLGVSYTFGYGVGRDLRQAAIWYYRSAMQGHAAAQNNLALSYAYGNGLKKDIKKAIYWYELAADHNYAPAQYSLGKLYQLGVEIPQDNEKATFWYQKAADKNHPRAKAELAKLNTELIAPSAENEPTLSTRKTEERPVTPPDNESINLQASIKDAQTATTTYSIEAAPKGDALASSVDQSVVIADSNQKLEKAQTLVEEEEYQQAMKILLPLATANDAKAQFFLGTLYYIGQGTAQDYTSAYLWYMRAAELGEKNAQYNLANMLMLGEGVKEDRLLAEKWYREAANQGHQKAERNLEHLIKDKRATP